MYIPFTGLGLYNGFRGERWLRNRITVFKNFVVPSLQNQTCKDFTVWISWRREERGNRQVDELRQWLRENTDLNVVFTYSGVCFWDDKYNDAEAYKRLVDSVHYTLGELMDVLTGEEILMTIQPSDDCYANYAVGSIQKFFRENNQYNAGGFIAGYIANYSTKEVSEYNPKTNPPFYTIKFPKEVFIDPRKQIQYTGPYKSHEYVPQFTKYAQWGDRGFLVGCHGENISTYYDHPFKGKVVKDILKDFGIDNSPVTKFSLGWKRRILKALPHRIRRKVRYWFSEKLYNFLRT